MQGIHLAVFSIYLQSGGCINTAPNKGIVAALMATLVMCTTPWIVTGDWNQDVEEVQDSGLEKKTKGVIVAPEGATIGSGSTLDFALMSREIASCTKVTLLEEVPFKPHAALVFTIEVDHGRLILPQLQSFPTVVQDDVAPYSKRADLTGTGCIGHCLLDGNVATKEFAMITASVEAALFPHTKITGCGWNVEVCHKPLVSTVEKRPWMGVVQARWSKLDTLVAQRDQCGSVVPRRRLETLLQNNAEADEPTLALNEVGNLVYTLLQEGGADQQWEEVSELIKRHLQEASHEHQEKRTMQYESWLEQALKGGMRPVFRAIRKHETVVERPFEDLPPYDRLLARRQYWAKLWQGSSHHHAQGWPELEARASQAAQATTPLTQQDVLAACRRGPDGWCTNMLKCIPEEAAGDLAALFREVELTGTMPLQWTISSIILLAKNSEVERPIALMHVVLKLFLKLRYPLVNQWIQDIKDRIWWDSAKAGVSCIDISQESPPR